MKRYKSLDAKVEAWIDVPDEWLLKHHATYSRAYQEMYQRNNDATILECRLAGALALVMSGDVKVNLPGVKADGDKLDISAVPMMSVRALLEAVANPIDLTQAVPFGWSEPSETG